MSYEEYVAERKARGLYFVPEDKWNQYMGQGEYRPDPRIRPYIYELLHDSSYVSGSHSVLFEVAARYGEAVVRTLLDEHWSFVREQSK